ncbi:MAG: SMC-Scp complex subunit ScpB [Bacteroidia bacterium]|nr:SMC-Scp complex subunit ScpB [Bacteroidia bacterium]
MHPDLSQIIESLVFAAEQPVLPAQVIETLMAANARVIHQDEEEPAADSSAHDAAPEPLPDVRTWEHVSLEEVTAILDALVERYQDPAYVFEVRKVAQGYQFFTKRTYYPYIQKANLARNQKRLTKPAMEVLAIIAYRQPVTKAEVEFIRGVNCDYAVQKLLEKNLISITGRSDLPGRPLLYATSPYFMQYFGIRDLSDMPRLKEFEELAEDHLELFRQQQEDRPQENPENEGKTGEEPLLEGSVS